MSITWGRDTLHVDDDLKARLTADLTRVVVRLGPPYRDADIAVFDVLSDDATRNRPGILFRVLVEDRPPSTTAPALCLVINDLAEFEAAWTWTEQATGEADIVWLSADGLAAIA